MMTFLEQYPHLTSYGEDMVLIDNMIETLRSRDVDDNHLSRLADAIYPYTNDELDEREKECDNYDNKVENLEQKVRELERENSDQMSQIDTLTQKAVDDVAVHKEFSELEDKCYALEQEIVALKERLDA